MHLQPEPLFNVPSDNVSMVAIEGTPNGRLFLAGRDACLYEITYQAVDGWFSKKCRKINHSISMVSFLVPSFLSFSEDGKLMGGVVVEHNYFNSHNYCTVYPMATLIFYKA